MKNSTISKQCSNTTDLYSTNAAKSHRLSMLWLMLLTLLLGPTRMVAQTTTDPRCALFNNLDGITDVTITDNSGNPWQMLDLNAEGMTNLGFDIPKGSKGLMSSNYNKDYSISEAFVKFKVEKPMLLTFKYLVSSKKSDQATITLDSKTYGTISEKKQIEIKALLPVGNHSLVLSYRKDPSGKAGADRAFIYDLKTATTISDYVAECDATSTTLTFKYFTSDNLGSLNFKHIAIVNNERTVQDVCTYYDCIKNIVFDESFKKYAPTSLRNFFKNCKALETISNLENLNTTKVTDMSYMFYGCSTLQTIYVSDNFVVTGITNESFKKNLFTGCEALPEYGDAKTSSDYANYKTGYFTKLVVRNGDERYGIKGETTQLTVDNLVLADGKDFVAYEPFTATAASYNRAMKEGTTWATLCLPFEVSLEGQNFRAFKLLSADEGSETVELEEIETSIEAGTPVIIKMKDGETKLNFSVENTAIAKDIQTAATADGNYQLQGLYTQKEFDKVADNNCYIVKGNKLMNPTKLLENTKVQKVASKPFRAYMVDKSSSAAGAKMFSIGISDSTTAIDSLNTIANDKAEYYDLHGKRLNEPQKGINIVKRGNKTMKVIIK